MENKIPSLRNISVNTPIVKLVQDIILAAYETGASDIHIDPYERQVIVRFRIDGMLQEACNFGTSLHKEVIARIKILAHLRTDEHYHPQDGRFRLAEIGLDIRVAVVPSHYGESIVVRLLRNAQSSTSLLDLGFSPTHCAKILSIVREPHGLLLVTGPTGSGKTTTLYSILQALRTPSVSIVTIEDPVEYAIAGVRQLQVESKRGLTFASALRSVLRQDPNIIMVGEIRDQETAGIAVNAALTGHLLLSTLHTNDAVGALVRCLDMRLEPYLVTSTVRLIINQRLVRTLCEHCALSSEPSSEELALLQCGEEDCTSLRQSVGCEECQMTGFRGRSVVCEVLEINEEIRQALLSKSSMQEIRTVARRSGFIPLAHDCAVKVRSGITTVSEMTRLYHE